MDEILDLIESVSEGFPTYFGHTLLTFYGHLVGKGQLKPVKAGVKAISDFPIPTCKRQLMQFLGMAGY